MRQKLSILALLLAFLCRTTSFADDFEEITGTTEFGIVFNKVVRVNFNYTTVDVDMETPVILSAAMFMQRSIYRKNKTPLGMMLLNHYTLTDNESCPSNVTNLTSLEYLFANDLKFILVESDNLGLGNTKDRVQPYLYGELTARQNIDALLAAKRLLAAQGYDVGDVVVNAGYSQGGHSGAWVDRVASSGDYSSELPKINFTLIGGGPYDIEGTYYKLLEDNYTTYPVALPMIFYTYLYEQDLGLKASDVFVPALANKFSDWFDGKQYDTDAINDSIYKALGVSGDGVAVDKIFTADVMNPDSKVMQKLIPLFRKNSLVSGDWSPSKTDRMMLFHSTGDDVVPYLNLENMKSFLDEKGYTNYDIENTYSFGHVTCGALYLHKACLYLEDYEDKIETGIKDYLVGQGFGSEPEAPVNVYSLDGKLMKSGVQFEKAMETLPKGVYIINGEKYIK